MCIRNKHFIVDTFDSSDNFKRMRAIDIFKQMSGYTHGIKYMNCRNWLLTNEMIQKWNCTELK